jgi:hypothetical protein
VAILRSMGKQRAGSRQKPQAGPGRGRGLGNPPKKGTSPQKESSAPSLGVMSSTTSLPILLTASSSFFESSPRTDLGLFLVSRFSEVLLLQWLAFLDFFDVCNGSNMVS